MSTILKSMNPPGNLYATAAASPSPGGSKRQPSSTSLNHLLNFTLPPREPVVQHRPRRNRRVDTSTVVWNKERFVNAQHRFILRPSGDYDVHFADPDIFFQWLDILEVIIPPPSTVKHPSTTLSCPICLSPPIAPRMTKCGHVYCYPCILHYLETSDNRRWARCPICFDSIYEKALRPVLFLPESLTQDDSIETGSIRMRLMVRPPNTTLVLPRSSSWPSALIPPLSTPYHFLPDVFTFSRFMLSTPQHLHYSAKQDLTALEVELVSLESIHDELGASFVRRAVDRISEWIDETDEMDIEQNSIKAREKVERELETFKAREKKRERERVREREKLERSGTPLPDAPADFLATSSAPTQSSPIPSAAQAGATPNRRMNVPPPPPPTYYYYQAANGSAVFLHPLDIRILRTVYGDYDKFPDEVVVGIEASEEGRVNPALRKTHKYLAHLPEGQDITFIEADLSTLCTPAQLAPFEELRRKRRERRREREEREERARRKAERDAEAELTAGWGRASGRTSMAEPRWERWDEVEETEEVDQAAEETSPPHAPASTSVPTAASTSPSGGAWGARTFASAAMNASSARARSSGNNQANRLSSESGEWEREVDLAWHELESRAAESGGGKKKGRKKLVLLGGGGGRRA